MHHRRSRKAQFATEFLMTYGWALIGISVVFAALYAFGILDVGSILPEKCTLTPGFTCRDYLVRSDNVTLQITNGIGKTIVIDTLDAAHRAYGICSGFPGSIIPNGDTRQMTINCPFSIPAGGKERFALNYTYHFQSDPATIFQAKGTLFAGVS